MANLPPIARALREAKHSVLQLALFQSIFDTIVAFTLLLLGCFLLSLPQWYAFIPTLIYAIIHTIGNLRAVNFSAIEDMFPDLKEQLITAADNWKEQNEIISALNEEVLHKMKDIRTSSFLNFPKITREIIVLAVASFIIIGASAYHVKFLDFSATIQKIRDFQSRDLTVNKDLLQYEEGQNLSDILGKKSISELGKKQLDLQINPLMSDVIIGKVKPPQDRKFQEVPLPKDIKATTDTSFEDQIPKQYQHIVKTYFKEITHS